MRIFLACLGCFPLLAPYELLIKPDWQHFLNLFFFLFALISVGATTLSATLFFSAVAGLSSEIVFDRLAATVSIIQEAPILQRRIRVYPLSDIQRVEIRERRWSEGEPTYYLSISLAGSSALESSSSWSRNDIERIKRRVDQFLAAA